MFSVVLGLAAGPSAANAGAKPVDPAKLAWFRSPGGAPGAGNLNALASNGKRFVVAGLAADEQAGVVPIWTSTDGLKWQRARAAADVFPAGSVVVDAVYDGKRFVAFGQPAEGAGTIAWTSSDGKTWKSYKGKGFPAGATENPVATARTKDGLVLLVRDDASNVHSLWSADGDTWKSLGPVPAAGAADVFLSRSVPQPSGKGYVTTGQQSSDAYAWTSSNGSQWNPVALSNDAQGFESARYVIDGGPGLVAVGTAPGPGGSSVASAWTSEDGATWQQADGGQAFTGQSQTVGLDVAARNDKSLLAAGHDGGSLALWSSSNGSSWTRIPDDPMFKVRNGNLATAVGVAAANGKVVALFRERRSTGTNLQLVGVGIVAGQAK